MSVADWIFPGLYWADIPSVLPIRPFYLARRWQKALNQSALMNADLRATMSP